MTALPACHVGSHKNCRRVAPLSPHSRAHARQTIGVTLFMFSSGAPFPGIGAAGVIIEASCGSPRTHPACGLTLSRRPRPLGQAQHGPESSCKAVRGP